MRIRIFYLFYPCCDQNDIDRQYKLLVSNLLHRIINVTITANWIIAL